MNNLIGELPIVAVSTAFDLEEEIVLMAWSRGVDRDGFKGKFRTLGYQWNLLEAQ